MGGQVGRESDSFMAWVAEQCGESSANYTRYLVQIVKMTGTCFLRNVYYFSNAFFRLQVEI